MSLLLDALKKTSDMQQKGTGASGLTLEEVPPARARSASLASSSRAAGESLFAAKKKKTAAGRWNLGLVPTTFLICSVLGGGYGYYVWLELQPPRQHAVLRTAPPPVPAAPPVSVAAVPLVPQVPATMEPAAPMAELPPPVTARSAERPPRKSPTSRPHSRPAADVAIRRNVEPDSITPILLDAWQAYQRGDYASAAQGYRQALGRDAHNRDALLGLAATAQQQGQDEASQRYYRQLLVLDPRDPVAHAALSAYQPADAADTESRLRQLLAGQPRSAALHFALGNLYAEQSGWSEAQQYYFNAYTLEPTNAQFAFNLAVSLDHLGQRKLAAQHYQQALQLDVSGNSGFDHAQAQQRLNELNTAR